MTLKRMLVAMVALAMSAFTFAMASPADAAWPYKAPAVKWTGHARFAGNIAWVHAIYRCYGGNQNTHIWVSLKQGPKISKMSLKQLNHSEGTSRIARAYYDTNPVDPQKVYVVCDGTWQHQTFRLRGEKGQMHRGHAYLQFCLFDSHSDPTGHDLSKGFAFKYSKPFVQHR